MNIQLDQKWRHTNINNFKCNRSPMGTGRIYPHEGKDTPPDYNLHTRRQNWKR
jgi:hypothetical protein